MGFIRFIVLLLIIIGALNWGLWGFFQYDFISDIFGGPSTGWARFVYAVVGLAGIWALSFFRSVCRGSGGGSCCPKKDQNQQDQNQGRQH